MYVVPCSARQHVGFYHQQEHHVIGQYLGSLNELFCMFGLGFPDVHLGCNVPNKDALVKVDVDTPASKVVIGFHTFKYKAAP